MKRLFCDVCKSEHSVAKPIHEYFIKAELEVSSNSVAETGPEYAIESRWIEICQPCAAVIAKACCEFIKSVAPEGDQP